MIKASALFYSIVISLIIAILSGSLLLVFYFNKLQLLSNIDSEKLERNSTSGINILLIDTNANNSTESKYIDLYGNGTDSILLKKKEWGMYELLISNAYLRGEKSIKIAEVGSDTTKSNKIALYLPESIYPLALCGKTIITGNCYLPKAGVKRGYIEGQTFIGFNLINGQIDPSTNQLPSVNDSLISKIKFLLNQGIPTKGLFIEKDINNDTLNNSFLDTTFLVYSNSDIDLKSQFIRGNIIIRSDRIITVESNAVLHDIILSAPVIVIKDEVEGNFQAFANDSLVIGNQVKLDYPSSVGVIRTLLSSNSPVLKIGQNDEIYGTVLAFQDKFQLNQSVSIKIPESAIINGLVFSNGTVEHKGIIYGSLISNKIVLKTPSAMYESYLLNCTIDWSKLPYSFVNSFLLKTHGNSKVAKWLY